MLLGAVHAVHGDRVTAAYQPAHRHDGKHIHHNCWNEERVDEAGMNIELELAKRWNFPSESYYSIQSL